MYTDTTARHRRHRLNDVELLHIAELVSVKRAARRRRLRSQLGLG